MTHEELKQRIDGLNLNDIKALSTKALGVLTDWWKNDALVKKIIAKAPDIGAQAETWSMLRNARHRYYNSISALEPYPEPFFNDIDVDLECGYLIKDPDQTSSATLLPQPLTREQGEKDEDSNEGTECLKEEFERLKQKREDMIVELLLPAFYNIDADARSFVRKIDNGMDSEGVAEVSRQFLQEKKITPSKKGRDIWKVLHAAKLYDRVEQSWTREMRKA